MKGEEIKGIGSSHSPFNPLHSLDQDLLVHLMGVGCLLLIQEDKKERFDRETIKEGFLFSGHNKSKEKDKER